MSPTSPASPASPASPESPESPKNPAPTRRLTTAQALVAFLARQYTERDGRRQRLISATWGIFGHGNVAGIGQALVEAGHGGNGTAHRMPYLQGRNEQAMVHAAVGYARQSGRLSAHAVTTSIGPGATNLVTGAALATINRLPVLLLPGDTFATRPADPVLQQLEVPYAGDVSVNDCLRPVSRYFDRITRPEALIPAALQAMRVLADPAETGAVTLALPQDVQAEAYDWPEEFFAERDWHVRRPAPDTYELETAVRAIRSARRPLIVAGGGVRHSAAEETLAAFTAATRIPVASTQAGKGALRHDHPADVGGIGHTGTATADELARTADLVIGIGTRFSDFTTASGTLFADPAVRFLHLNITAFDAHKLAALPLVADARAGLEALTAALAGRGYRVDPAYETEYTGAKEAWEERVEASFATPDPTARPTQTQVLGLLDDLVTEEDILINAAGSLPGDLHKLWRTRSRDQYHVEYGYSCMGYEIPAAIGVLLATGARSRDHRPVWALVGDGTYLMNPTEIVTAVQENLPLKLLILQNHGYASIGGLSASVGAEGFGTAYRHRDADGGFTGPPLPVDLAANAASLGLRVLRAATVDDLRKALSEARDAEGPTCVYVETETPDTVSGPPPAQAWWDVPVAETASRPAAVKAREEYDRQVAARRRHL
ncbi:3D-(3,5/4)-trihydroxycyclohexane-1,2-dione acylhydrolase (decyclizing) [Streptomyces rubiginosohelvolus]|uniref:3D-(3,5/4)-trihydroxycyclohexane-1,2-dione acylhydrolase (decyclizing) n=1 Tax=unclassified Streptomyces TaxID=2593676 RepID=UPI00190BC518|nr:MULTISPECIES: 3D-(3,5/4)-trihydroxycyclohexane-1,2-dione acylhydrolase (decyclizing) [unclassified Streptomyces]MBK3534262.1 3D-(3,5/4)-trihydroxycyclohexane-1,2-dione acylhydrolase (decyclizing) [Streptomyces sp. MBT72]MBK3541185.1 3D-(3,5/4)-trihydroxycyclohexane-1,2-dione acylhydrolase (decyclizing) [Streptomyces sp. MBT67]MBK3554727.1 3D-(3,5/4)-trihydroxycyclohexane-1,2-dione acylhydrolase (decyclizing) [Streptomyces sp. MBT61]MBK6033502.1 3D-(3,5/4)-trihydroxycyclohexane-1,2-dione acyl